MSRAAPISVGEEARTAITRWKLGHHAFHLYLVAMNTLLEDALEAAKSAEWPSLARSLREFTTLLDATTASMKYASDFPSRLYDELVRPSMMPPFLSPAFSGELNKEHELMLDQVKALRRRLKEAASAGTDLPEEVAEVLSGLRSAIVRNRRHHMLVCEKHVQGGVSLVREFYENPEKDGHQENGV